MSFESAEQFYAASLEVAREHLEETRRLREAVKALTAALQRPLTPVYGAPAQLELVGSANGHAPAPPATTKPEAFVFRSRLDAFGQELPRGISWDPSGEVWQVDVTAAGRRRRRVRIPADRFPGRPELGLEEARLVHKVLQGGQGTRHHAQALHQDTARDVTAALAR